MDGLRLRRPRESDVRGLLAQQMVHWGLDARHPDGNLFVRTGFERLGRPADGTSSIYRLEWTGGGSIELHGTYVRWEADGRAHVFLRGSRRLGVNEAFDPSCPHGAVLAGIPAGSLEEAVRPLLVWVSDHEQRVLDCCGHRWRELGWKKLRSLPLGPAWAAPEQTREWLRGVVAAGRRGKQ